MTSARAIAIDIRAGETNALIGVAMVVAAARHLSVLREDGQLVQPDVAPQTWNEIDEWIAGSDAGLPARPGPISPRIMSAIFPDDSAISAQRVASIPLDSDLDYAWIASAILPALLRVRLTADPL